MNSPIRRVAFACFALFAMLLAVENDFQAALMAPTELLAEQHAATLGRLLEPLTIRPELLVGRQSATEKSAVRTPVSWAMMNMPTSCVLPMLARVTAAPTWVHAVPLLDQYADTSLPRRLSFSHLGTVLVPPATDALSWPLPSGSVPCSSGRRPPASGS